LHKNIINKIKGKLYTVLFRQYCAKEAKSFLRHLGLIFFRQLYSFFYPVRSLAQHKNFSHIDMWPNTPFSLAFVADM
jgi:hypothetical protein